MKSMKSMKANGKGKGKGDTPMQIAEALVASSITSKGKGTDKGSGKMPMPTQEAVRQSTLSAVPCRPQGLSPGFHAGDSSECYYKHHGLSY